MNRINVEQLIVQAGNDAGFTDRVFPLYSPDRDTYPILIYTKTGETRVNASEGSTVVGETFRLEIQARNYADLKKHDDNLLKELQKTGRLVTSDAVFDDWGEGKPPQQNASQFTISLEEASGTMRRIRTVTLQ